MYDKPAIRENGWFFLFAAAEPLPAEQRMQKKKSHARGEACGEGKGNLRGDKGGREKERNGEDGKGLYCWDAP